MQQDSNPNPNLTGLLVWDFKRAVHNRTPANLDELKQRCKEEAKILHNNVRDSWSQKENDDFKLLLLKVVLQAIEAGGGGHLALHRTVLWKYFLFHMTVLLIAI